MGSIAELQNILDENKEKLPDGVYLKMCDALKAEFDHKNEEEENKTSYYRCTFIDTKFILVDLSHMNNNYCLQFCTFTRIVKMSDSFFNEIEDDIEAKGISDTSFFNCNKDQRLIAASDTGDGWDHTEITIDTRSSIVKIEKL
jgi:hypothetical protein